MSRESSTEVEAKLLKLAECIPASLYVCCPVCLFRYTLEVLQNNFPKKKKILYHNQLVCESIVCTKPRYL